MKSDQPAAEPEPRKPLIEEIETPEEKEVKYWVDKALANDDVRQALQDPKVKELIDTLSSNPDKGQWSVLYFLPSHCFLQHTHFCKI